MKTAMLKDALREIKKRFSQFLSIVAILALGVSFFVGIRVTGSNMRITADRYFDDTKFMDIKLISTLGLDNESIETLQATDGIESVFPSISIDTYAQMTGNERIIKTIMLPPEGENSSMNLPALSQGELPSNSNECVMDDALAERENISIGDIISLIPEEESDFTNLEYKVVGTVSSPLYIDYDRGYTSIGDGELSGFIYLQREAFALDIYTEAYISVAGGAELSCYSDEYESMIANAIDAIKANEGHLKDARLEAVRAPLQKELDEAYLDYEQGKQTADNELSDAKDMLDSARAELDNGISQFGQGISAVYTAMEKPEEDFGEDYAAAVNELARIANNYINTQSEALSFAYQQLEEFHVQYPESALQYEVQKAALDDAAMQLDIEKQTLNTTLATLKTSAEELAMGEQEYEQGKSEYEQNLADVEKELNEAKTKLDDAQAEIDKLGAPTIYIQDRAYITSYSSFLQDSDRIEAIGRVIPVIFFLVAALVTLSAISRMVEEQRVQIGTLKALGYSSSSIAPKYIFFALFACVLGIAFGAVVGFNILPTVIFNAYRIMYAMPELIHPFQIEFLIAPTMLSLICTVFTAYLACKIELRSVPAALIRPAAPPAGKRVLLERVGFIWSRLSFLYKVTVRNLMRNKSRFWMSSIGIAGCTGLLIVGFGLRDSIGNMVSMQFDELYSYKTELILNTDADTEDMDILSQKLDSHEQIEQDMGYLSQSVDAYTSKSSYGATIVVPENTKEFEEFTKLRTRIGHKKLKLSSDGVIIDEKLAKLLDISVGENITISNIDEGLYFSVPVSGITENYLLHYIYIDSDYYNEITGRVAEPTNIMLKLSGDLDNLDSINTTELMELEAVKAVINLTSSRTTFESMMESFDMVIWVIIAAAATLAFVVLFNLSAININERLREIATIKVLGFYDRETTIYIFRENVVLTFIGSLFGIVLGIVMHRFVLVTAEIDMVMFMRKISILSYVLSVVITFVFAFLVNIFVHFKLKKIDMASALKSVE